MMGVESYEKRTVLADIVQPTQQQISERTLSGYAVKWDTLSLTMGGEAPFKEQFKRGAFEESIQKHEQFFYLDHDSHKMLGRTSSGTLRLEEDSTGLRFELDVPDTQLGSDLYKMVQRGDIKNMSFGFQMIRDEWNNNGPISIRTVVKAMLLEVSAVARPAYPDSVLSIARNMTDEEKEQRKRLILQTYL